MKSFLLAALAHLGHGYLRRGDCTSGGGNNCISPVNLEEPEKLAPATIATNTNNQGFVTAEALDGDKPSGGDQELKETAEDIADRFMVDSPKLEMPPSPPPLIMCEYDQCTTSTTTRNPAFER